MPLAILSLENQSARRGVAQDAMYFRRDGKDVTVVLHDSYEFILRRKTASVRIPHEYSPA
jgi:hypothetical protein